MHQYIAGEVDVFLIMGTMRGHETRMSMVKLLRTSVSQDVHHADARFVLSCKAVNDCVHVNMYVTVDMHQGRPT